MNTGGEQKRKALGRGLSALISAQAVPVSNINISAGERNKISTNIISKISDTHSENTAENSQKVKFLEINSLLPSKVQPRQNFNKQELDELASSIKTRGILQPILVRPISKDNNSNYEIIAGERRWRAAKLANLLQVPVIINNFTDTEAAEVALIENIQRSDLNPVEEALAYQSLIDNNNFTQQEVAERVGKERSSVANLLRILSLHQDVLHS